MNEEDGDQGSGLETKYIIDSAQGEYCVPANGRLLIKY